MAQVRVAPILKMLRDPSPEMTTKQKDKIAKKDWAIKNGLMMSQVRNNGEAYCQPVVSEEQTKHWSGARFNQVHSYLSSDLDKHEDTDGLNYMGSLLLDTAATFSSVRNRALIAGVTKVKDTICMGTNLDTKEPRRTWEVHGIWQACMIW